MESTSSSTGPVQQLFPGASHFAISGSKLNAIAGDYVVHGLDREEVERMLCEMRCKLVAEMAISHRVGFSRGNGVTIIDAFGRDMVLPPSIVASYWDVHDILSKHFRCKIGEDRVAERNYRLVSERDGTVVGFRTWERAMKPGEVFVMCMVTDKVRAYSDMVNEACPKCGKTRLGTMRDGGFLTCRRCEKSFLCFDDAVRRIPLPPQEQPNMDIFKHVMKTFVMPVRCRFIQFMGRHR